eukprot:jgi/Chlat1/5053/Chrsp33S05053
MASKLPELQKLFDSFKQAYAVGDLKRCSDLLVQLKIKLTEFSSLPPLYKESQSSIQELTVARDILEHAVLLSVRLRDEAAFERNFQQLKAYYTDTTHLLAPSAQQYCITGLNLLRLLVQNRIAEFHTEVELIPPQAQASPHIHHAIAVEQSLMEGAYNKVLSARNDIPDSAYGYFMDLLITTVRDEVAGCSEKAYTSLKLGDARKMMMLPSDAEALEYAQQRGWEVRDSTIYFTTKEMTACRELPSLQIIDQTLAYARELERIV